MRPIATKLHLFAVALTVGLTSGARGDDLPAPTILKGHTGGVRSVAFSPDGALLASASWDNTVRLWNRADGKEIRVWSGQGRVRSVAFSPDGKKLAVAGEKLMLWDAASGAELRTFDGHKDMVAAVVFAPDGKTLASAGADKTVRLWNVAKGTTIRTLVGPENGLFSLACSPDGKSVVAAGGEGPFHLWNGGDGTASLWGATTGKPLKTFAGHESAVESVAFSPDGKTVASASWDGTVRFWDAPSGKQLHACLADSTRARAVAFTPDGKAAASAGADGTVRVWDVVSGKEIAAFTDHGDEVAALAFSPDGKHLVAAGAEAKLVVREWFAFGPRSPTAVAEGDLPGLWDQLTGEDAGRAWQAVGVLAQSPRQSVPFLRDHVRPVAAPTAERLKQLLGDLENPEFAVREQAAATLTQLGELAAPTLRRVLENKKPALELRRRVEAVLDVPPTWSDERLRLWRAIQVLERIGTPEARAVLKTLAEGTASSRVTQEAQAAQRRLARD